MWDVATQRGNNDRRLMCYDYSPILWVSRIQAWAIQVNFIRGGKSVMSRYSRWPRASCMQRATFNSMSNVGLMGCPAPRRDKKDLVVNE